MTEHRSPHEIQSQLDELEELYRSAPVGLCLVDREFRFVRINERLAAINGHPVADHVGRTVEEVIPEFAGQILPRYRKVLETGQRIENVEVVNPDSDRTWLVTDHPLRADGAVTGIITVVQEITELKRREADLRVTRERLRMAERVAGLGCWEWALEKGDVWWSRELYRIMGRDPETFHPTFDDFIDHVVSEDRRHVREQLDAVWNGLPEATAEFRVVTGTGEERRLRGIALLRRDGNGAPRELFGTSQDITEEHRAQQAQRAEMRALSEANDSLRSLLEQRSRPPDAVPARRARKVDP